MKVSNRKISYGKDRVSKINDGVDRIAKFYIPEARGFIEANRHYILDNYILLFKDLNDEKEKLLDLIIPKMNNNRHKKFSNLSLLLSHIGSIRNNGNNTQNRKDSNNHYWDI